MLTNKFRIYKWNIRNLSFYLTFVHTSIFNETAFKSIFSTTNSHQQAYLSKIKNSHTD
jgi:hypothetical protein